MYRELFLAVVVSIDTYLASAAYCNSSIRIPFSSAFIISFICAAVLGAATALSGFLGAFISADICRIAGAGVLSFIGAVTILKSLIRSLVKHISERGELSLKLKGCPLILRLYLDDTAADTDNSKTLSAGEAAALAIASSLDSAATGLSSGFSGISPVFSAIFAFICGISAIYLGWLTGRKISSLGHDLSWVGGGMLIAFAFVNL